MKQVFIISAMMAFISLAAFFIPNSLSLYAFSGRLFFQGEAWRIITFPFVHVNFEHLIENVLTLMLTSLLAFEFELKGTQFLAVFMISIAAIALADSFLMPSTLIAGLSLGVYSILGFLSMKGSNFIPWYVIVPLLGLSPFLRYIVAPLDNAGITQSLFHFSGFWMGIGVFYLFRISSKRKRVLQGDLDG